MKTFCLILIIGSCLAAQAADPNDSKPSTRTVPAVAPVVETAAPSLPSMTRVETTTPTPPPITVPALTPAVESPSVNLPRTLTPAVGIPAWVLPPAPTYVPAVATVAAPFKDKIMRVEATIGYRNQVFTLENVKLTSLLGTEFLVGTGVKNENDRYFGLEVYVSMRDIHTIIAMTSEQAKKFDEQRPGRRQSNLPPGFNPGGPLIPSPGSNPPGDQAYRNERYYTPAPARYPPQEQGSNSQYHSAKPPSQAGPSASEEAIGSFVLPTGGPKKLQPQPDPLTKPTPPPRLPAVQISPPSDTVPPSK